MGYIKHIYFKSAAIYDKIQCEENASNLVEQLLIDYYNKKEPKQSLEEMQLETSRDMERAIAELKKIEETKNKLDELLDQKKLHETELFTKSELERLKDKENSARRMKIRIGFSDYVKEHDKEFHELGGEELFKKFLSTLNPEAKGLFPDI